MKADADVRLGKRDKEFEAGAERVTSMAIKVAPSAADCHPALPEKSRGQLRVSIRKAESDDSWKEIGECLEFAQNAVGWSLKELAGAIGRDERQISRWIRGDERTQVDAVFAVARLRQPFVIALAKLAECEIETVVRVRRSA